MVISSVKPTLITSLKIASQKTSPNFFLYFSASFFSIILGILLSVIVAFTVGAIVQYFSRVIYSFNFESRPTYINSLFGGFAITSITYFIIIKGLKGTQFYGSIKEHLEGNTLEIITISFIIWTIISYLITKVFKLNILVLIIGNPSPLKSSS